VNSRRRRQHQIGAEPRTPEAAKLWKLSTALECGNKSQRLKDGWDRHGPSFMDDGECIHKQALGLVSHLEAGPDQRRALRSLSHRLQHSCSYREVRLHDVSIGAQHARDIMETHGDIRPRVRAPAVKRDTGPGVDSQPRYIQN
jgi:hypothetical protein